MAITLEVAMLGSIFSQRTALVRHYHSPTATIMPSVAELCDLLADRWENSMNSRLSSQCSWDSMIIRNVVAGSVGLPYSPPLWPLVGELGPAMPSFCSINIRLNAIESIKPTHGWARLPGLPIGSYVNNLIEATARSAIQVSAFDYFTYAPATAGGAGAWIPVIYSRTSQTFNPIQLPAVQATVGHVVGRHVGHGS